MHAILGTMDLDAHKRVPAQCIIDSAHGTATARKQIILIVNVAVFFLGKGYLKTNKDGPACVHAYARMRTDLGKQHYCGVSMWPSRSSCAVEVPACVHPGP